MRLFDLLSLLDADVTPERCKLHLAMWDGRADPLHLYLAGEFDEWQRWQRRRNFQRPLVVSLIALPQPERWLFAGVHEARGAVARGDHFYHELMRRTTTEELDGRLVVAFERPGRQSYLRGERWFERLQVAEIRPERLCVSDFRGYSWTLLTKAELDLIVRHGVASWRAALSAVSGVYVIADRATGKLYVGSATAGEGLWSRWCAYSATGHGGNVELKALLTANEPGYEQHFQFGILEVADSHASQEDVLQREAYWKDLLQTRAYGYNRN